MSTADDSVDLDAIAEENARLRNECEQLEQTIKELTRSHDLNLSQLQRTREELIEENAGLEAEIQERRRLMKQARALYLSQSPDDISRNRSLDPEFWASLNKHFPRRESNERVDPVVAHIISSNPYFAHCHSNSSFIDRCAELVQELGEVEEQNSGERLRSERFDFQRHFAGEAIELKKLINKKLAADSAIERRRKRVSARTPEREPAAVSPTSKRSPHHSPFAIDDWQEGGTPQGERRSLFLSPK